MRTAFYIATNAFFVAIACGYPFVAILRGKRFFHTVGIGWALVFLGMLTLCLLLPMLVGIFDKDFAREMMESWVPEGPAVVAGAFMGWMPPLMGAAVGVVAKSLLNRFWPAMSERIEQW